MKATDDKTIQMLESRIKTREMGNSTEIRDNDGPCPTITVYRPSRQPDFKAEGNKVTYRISPGYINASSFQIGSHSMSRTVENVQNDLVVFNHMMEAAIDLLNEYNSVVLEWEHADNPMKDARYFQSECEKHRTRLAEEQSKKDARKKR